MDAGMDMKWDKKNISQFMIKRRKSCNLSREPISRLIDGRKYDWFCTEDIVLEYLCN